MTTATVPEFTVPDRMIKAREFAGHTQASFAAALGVSESTVKRMENGTKEVRPFELAGWAFTAGVPVSWLLTGHVDAEADTGRNSDQLSFALVA